MHHFDSNINAADDVSLPVIEYDEVIRPYPHQGATINTLSIEVNLQS